MADRDGAGAGSGDQSSPGSKGSISGAPYQPAANSSRPAAGETTGRGSPEDAIARQIASTSTEKKGISREQKIIAAVLGTGVAVALIVVIIMATNLIAPNEKTPGGAGSSPTATPSTGPAPGEGGSPGECALRTVGVVPPVGWVWSGIEGGCGLGPAGSAAVMEFREGYKGELESLRPKCAGSGTPTPSPSETPDPFATATSPSPSRSTIASSPSTGPTATKSPDSGGGSTEGTVKNLQTRVVPSVAGVSAQSESGTLECDGGVSIPFTSVLVTSKKVAITYGRPDLDTNYALANLTFL